MLRKCLTFSEIRFLSSTTINSWKKNVGVWSDIRCYSEVEVEKKNVLEVSTTGYSFLKDGKRFAKYGIYWGPHNSRNCLQTLPTAGASHVAAILTGLLKVIHTVREEENPQPIVVYTDLKYKNFLQQLSKWAKRDFLRSDTSKKMQNYELLNDIYVAVQGLDIKVIHRKSCENGEPNKVVKAILKGHLKQNEKEEDGKLEICNVENKAEPLAQSELLEDHIVDKAGRITSKSLSKTWPQVYIGVKCQKKKNFVSAGYCTHWTNGEAGGGNSFRFAPYPVTEFRATLAAIEEALKEAVNAKIPRIVIVTSSAHFIKAWKKRWISNTGNSYKGKEFYDRINDLCKRMKEVHFRYETRRNELAVFDEIERKCKEGLSFPLVGKDKSEYELEIEDLVIPEESLDSNLPLVRHYKSGTDRNAGYVWNKSSSEGTASVGVPNTIIQIMEEAIERNYETIIVRTDSSRLIKSFAAHLEVWKRNGWRNSLNKPIQRMELWERAWELKQKVKIYWQLMKDDELEKEDGIENRKIPDLKESKIL